MAPYEYPPLRTTNTTGTPSWPTRLLLLYPGTADQPLECKIISVESIDAFGYYEALSYVCGPETPTGSIRCHDTETTPTTPTRCQDGDMSIRLNLFHALKAIRHLTTTRLIWIDALCINQSDLEERGRQVRHMRQIYKHAGRVIVWLGFPDEAQLAAFCSIRDMCDSRKKFRAAYPDTIVEEATYDPLRNNPTRLANLVQLFENEYFQRVWCVQEVVAARQCIAQCGNETMDFRELLPLIQHAQPRAPALSLLPNPLRIWKFVYGNKGRVAPRSKEDRSLGTVLFVLTALREMQSTDPRDRIYVALGISDEGMNHTRPKLSSLPGVNVLQFVILLITEWLFNTTANRSHDFRLSSALEPNYAKPLMEVYRDFTRWSIHEQPQVLFVLSLLQRTPQTLAENWPSWVPHFDHNRRTSLFQGEIYRAGIQLRSPFCYQAEMLDFPFTMAPQEPNVLQLGGFLIDTVAQITNPMALPAEHDGHLDIEQPWNELFDEPLFPRPNADYALHEEKRDVAYFLTLCVGMLGGMVISSLHNSPPSPPTDDHRPFIDKCYALVKENLLLWLVERRRQDPLAYPNLVRSHDEEADARNPQQTTSAVYHTAVFSHNLDRRVYLTASGRLGLGPGAMKAGDRVVVLFGGSMPFILRPTKSGDWSLIGDSYVHDYDVMKGDRVDLVRKGTGGGPDERRMFRIV